MTIGGVERVINQVDTFVEYSGGDVSGMTATEIFYGARADRLSKKVLQMETDNLALQLARGVQFLKLPKILYGNIDEFEGDTNVDKARNAEIHYAKKAAKISRGAKKWNHKL